MRILKPTNLTQPIAGENVEQQKFSFIAGEAAKMVQTDMSNTDCHKPSKC